MSLFVFKFKSNDCVVTWFAMGKMFEDVNMRSFGKVLLEYQGNVCRVARFTAEILVQLLQIHLLLVINLVRVVWEILLQSVI